MIAQALIQNWQRSSSLAYDWLAEFRDLLGRQGKSCDKACGQKFCMLAYNLGRVAL